MYSADFVIFRRISVTRQWNTYTMEVNETRKCLVTDIFLNIKKKIA